MAGVTPRDMLAHRRDVVVSGAPAGSSGTRFDASRQGSVASVHGADPGPLVPFGAHVSCTHWPKVRRISDPAPRPGARHPGGRPMPRPNRPVAVRPTRIQTVSVRLALFAGAIATVGLVGLGLIDLAGESASSALRDAFADGLAGHVAEVLAAREYQVSAVDGQLQAPNRRQDLRTVFTRDGVIVTPRRLPEAGGWRWQWRTVGWGRETLTPPAPVNPVSHVVRVDYARDDLSEWYINGESGLEQGFTVHARPAGEGALRIVGRISGDLAPRAGTDGIDFVDTDQVRRLRYDGLKTFDATGREVPGTIDVACGEVTLAIDDRDAVYPLTVDPLVSTPPWHLDGPDLYAGFGARIAPAGDVDGDGYSDVIVGSPDWTDTGYLHHGHAWVLLGGPGGLLSSFDLDVSGSQDEGEFGYSVASAGDVDGDGYDDVLVGMPSHEGGLYENGRVYLYYGSPSGVQTTGSWYADSDLSSRFGFSVATAGDIDGDGHDDIVVGDPFTGSWSSGRLSVKYGAAGGLSGHTMDWSEMGGYESWLGYSVATAGDIDGDGYDDVVAGAPRYHSGQIDEGAIYVYHGSASGVVSPPAIIQSDEELLGLGRQVVGAGDVDGDGHADVLVGCVPFGGAPHHDEVRLYLGGPDGLQTTPAWIRSVGDPAVAGGWSIGSAGDVNGDGYADVLLHDGTVDGDITDQGRLELFLGHHDGLATTAAWSTLGPDDPDDGYGRPVTAGDVDGDGFSDVLASAPAHDLDRGRLYCFHGGPLGLREDGAGWVTEPNQAGASYGFMVASAGDVNADGFDDVLVGAPFYDNGQVDEGVVFLFLGGNTGLLWVPVWWAESNQADARLGTDVASAGDVNGDGLCDVIVGAPRYATGGDQGAAFAWYSADGGIPSGTPANADWSYHAGQPLSSLGAAVDCAGDVNGDGYADVIVGSGHYDNGQLDEGAAFVFHGSAGGLEADWAWFHDTDKVNSGYGLAVAGAGDVNGDGFSDVLVGAPFYGHPEVAEGLAFLYLGSADGVLPGAPWWYAQSDQVGAYLGFGVDGAGDIDGDGHGDVIIGAPGWNGIATDVGAAMIWYGGPTPPPVGAPDNADRMWAWLIGDARFGHSVASAGDVNADGYGDIVIGCPRNDATYTEEGFAMVYLGSADGLESDVDWLVTGPSAGAHFGQSVASAGDVDGDGFSDLIVGAPGYGGGQSEEGRAFLYHGGGGHGTVRAARQWQADMDDRIGPLGASETMNGFGLTIRGRTPRGRGLVRYEYEVEPYGTPFDGNGTVLGLWTDTGQPNAWSDLAAEVSGLTAGTAYTWRIRLHGHSPYFPRSPWQTLSWNGATEHDLRTAGTTVAVWDDATPAADPDVRCQPNPFNPRTTITYAVPQSGPVTLTIVDLRGRVVRKLIDEVQTAGRRAIDWAGDDDDGRSLGSGVYLAVLETAAGRSTAKVSLVK
ncbi:T9SS type A sorting domain-containing protein [bacterium]|nr:T9SS type A sorting domain-containing protein [bacterium]